MPSNAQRAQDRVPRGDPVRLPSGLPSAGRPPPLRVRVLGGPAWPGLPGAVARRSLQSPADGEIYPQRPTSSPGCRQAPGIPTRSPAQSFLGRIARVDRARGARGPLTLRGADDEGRGLKGSNEQPKSYPTYVLPVVPVGSNRQTKSPVGIQKGNILPQMGSVSFSMFDSRRACSLWRKGKARSYFSRLMTSCPLRAGKLFRLLWTISSPQLCFQEGA